MSRQEIVQRFLDERARQVDLPGREFDVRNGPNDWAAIAGCYLFEETRRGAMKPNREAFEDSLVKVGAIIIAALEHCALMEDQQHFS